MSSKRRLSTFSLLLAAFVFLSVLLTSCGIPVYYVPDITIKKTSSGFSIAFDASESLGSDGHVGLLLLYYLSDEEISYSTSSDPIIKKFKSDYIRSDYDGDNVTVKDESPLFTVDSKDVYAFGMNGTVVSAPDYVCNLTDALDGSASYSFNTTFENGIVKLSSGSNSYNLSIDTSGESSTDNYIHIYAAVCVQSKDYSNIFWSGLVNVGYLGLSTN